MQSCEGCLESSNFVDYNIYHIYINDVCASAFIIPVDFTCSVIHIPMYQYILSFGYIQMLHSVPSTLLPQSQLVLHET